MTEVEKLRALLAEAREVARAVRNAGSLPYAQWTRDQHEADSLVDRIDAALAEPVVGCASCGDKTYGELLDDNVRVRRERDEARFEAARYRKALEPIADGTTWNSKEAAEFALGRKP